MRITAFISLIFSSMTSFSGCSSMPHTCIWSGQMANCHPPVLIFFVSSRPLPMGVALAQDWGAHGSRRVSTWLEEGEHMALLG